MMKFLNSCLLLAASTATLQAEEPCLTFIVHSPNTNTRASAQSKKNSHNASILLQALAQSCNQLGQVVNASTTAERQQGILNLIGTVLTTAAELSSKKNEKPTQEIVAQLPVKLTRITDMLLQEYTRSPIKEPLPATIALLNSIPDQANREAMIGIYLSSTDARNQYLDDLFALLTTYVLQAVPGLMQHIKDMIHQLFLGPVEQQPTPQAAPQENEQPKA